MTSGRAIFLIGVSGCGKSTIGELLASKMKLALLEGDDFHPEENIRKMSEGTPLTDNDRWPWLKVLAHRVNLHVRGADVVVTCSALKASYRKFLKKSIDREIVWIALNGDKKLLRTRMQKRDHFMPEDLLQSQLSTWEPPEQALNFDISESPSEIVDGIISKLEI
ncbi:MAG: gluconokinase [Bacteroidia bacterium]|nr:gluconokinase [Bacteroidia bacterium]